MKYTIILLTLLFSFSSVNGQKMKKSSLKSSESTTIKTKYGTAITQDGEFSILLPQKGSKFDKGAVYILTKDGQKLRIDGDIQVSYPSPPAGQPTSQGGTITDVTQSVTFGDGGSSVTISTTTTTKGADGSISSSTKSTTIDTNTGDSSRTVTVSNGQGTPDLDVTVVIE